MLFKTGCLTRFKDGKDKGKRLFQTNLFLKNLQALFLPT